MQGGDHKVCDANVGDPKVCDNGKEHNGAREGSDIGDQVSREHQHRITQ